MTSPPPYWSSRIMKIPARKSLTRLWAPNPRATPATPADVSSGPSGMPRSAMTVSTASVATVKVTMLRSSDPTVSTRWRWRSVASPAALAITRPVRLDSARRRADLDVMVVTTRSMSRRSTQTATTASTTVTSTRTPSVSSQLRASSRNAATVLVDRPDRRAGVRSVTGIALLGGQGPRDRVAVLADEAAQGRMGVGARVQPRLGRVVQPTVGERAGVEAVDDRLDEGVRPAGLHRVEHRVVAP